MVSARAHAALNLISLPAMSLSAPLRVGGDVVALPNRLPANPVKLPWVSPQLPLPADALLFSPNLPIRAIRLSAAAADDRHVSETLDRLYDTGEDSASQPPTPSRPHGDGTLHTLPENDLLNEIGI